jgi:Fur family transcriptional regulator, peroxide stress response regulator
MNIKNLLTEAQLKATHQREVILALVLDCKNHPSAEYVYELTKEQIPSISVATVYKTLEAFVKAGLISKTLTTEGQLRFDPNLSSHAHIYSNNSNEIIDYNDDELNAVISDFFKKKMVKNFHIKKISLNILGDKIDPEKSISIQ